MTERQSDDHTLEAMFAEARAEKPPLPDDLFARIMADAAAEQTPEPRRPRGGWFTTMGAMLGGWPSMAGLATAAVAGIWIGIAQPAALSTFGLAAADVGASAYDLGDLMPGFDALGNGG